MDLGLPSGLKWADRNVGAQTVYDYGWYACWGETENRTDFSDPKTYKFEGKDEDSWFSKYNPNSRFGPVDNKTRLDLEDDMAHVAMGGDWRMPTKSDMEELIKYTTYEWVNNYKGTNVNGIVLTSIVEGYTDKSIFIPAGGEKVLSKKEVEIKPGSDGFLNTSDMPAENTFSSYYLQFYNLFAP